MTAAIMMCTYNRLSLTKETLTSLFLQTTYPFRLIIVDNGSGDDTAEFLKNYDWEGIENLFFKGIDLHFNQENLGIAIGRNQALHIANKYKDAYLATIDNDVLFLSNWLYECVNFLDANPKFMIGQNFERTKYPLHLLNGKKAQLKDKGNLGTATAVFPRTLFEEIGFFNMEWGLYSCEDSDYGFRARIAGYRMAYLSEMGKHLGEGENDIGKYRDFKTKQHNEIAPKFRISCSEYLSGKKPIYIGFEWQQCKNISTESESGSNE